MLPSAFLAILLLNAVRCAPVAYVAPLLQPFFALPDEAPAGAASSVFVEEFGAAGSNVVAYEGVCLAYTHYGPGLSINVLDVAPLFQNGTFAVTTLRNDTSMAVVSGDAFDLVAPAATSTTGVALLSSTANLFHWNAASGYPNATALTTLSDDAAVASALLAASVPTIGVISYLTSVQIGLPCLGIRPGNNDAFIAHASLRTLYKYSYSANQSSSKCVSSGVNAIAYPLIGCVTMRLVRNASACNAVAENLVAKTLRTIPTLLLGTNATGILPLYDNDAVVAYTQFLTKSCVSTTVLQLGGSSADDFLIRWLIAGYGKPGFSASHAAVSSSAAISSLSREQYLAGFSELTVSQVAATTALGNATLQMLPSALIGCPLVYNLPGRPDLRLPRCVVPAIMRGEITMWNDPAIQEVNPRIALPAQPIKITIRGDGGGTTACAQAALAAVEESCNQIPTFRSSSTWLFNTSTLQVRGSSAMTKTIDGTAFTLGYLAYDFVKGYGLQMASLIDTRTGEIAAYDTMQVKNITIDPVSLEVSFPPPNFPFVAASYLVFTSARSGNCSDMRELAPFLEWIVSSTAARVIIESSGFIPYAESIMAAGLQRLHATAMCGGEFLYAQPVFHADHTMAIVIGAVGAPMGVLLLLMIALAIHLADERKKKQEQVTRSIQLTTDIADALCDYDLEYVDALLDEYCSNQHHNAELTKPFRELRQNLGEYRPYLPRYLLPDSSVAGDLSQRLSSESHHSKNSDSFHSKASGNSSVDSHRSKRAKKSTSNLVKYGAEHSKSIMHTSTTGPGALGGPRPIALAAVDFIGSTYCTSAPKSKLTSAASIDTVAVAVHEALAATGGVLHCFIGDSVVASWGSAKSMQQPEKKACHFLCILQKSVALKEMQMTGAVVSGEACCHAGGDSKQRTLVVCGPAMFARLDASRTLAQQSGALVIDNSVRKVVSLDFTTMPYSVQHGELFHEIIKDLSENDDQDEEWLYRVAKADNAANEKLQEAGRQWLAGRHSDAHKTLNEVVSNDEAITSRLPALRARIPSS